MACAAPPLPLSSLSPLFLERVERAREQNKQRIHIDWTGTHSLLTVVGPGPTLHSKTHHRHASLSGGSWVFVPDLPFLPPPVGRESGNREKRGGKL